MGTLDEGNGTNTFQTFTAYENQTDQGTDNRRVDLGDFPGVGSGAGGKDGATGDQNAHGGASKAGTFIPETEARLTNANGWSGQIKVAFGIISGMTNVG
jgi:hypothetical protein